MVKSVYEPSGSSFRSLSQENQEFSLSPGWDGRLHFWRHFWRYRFNNLQQAALLTSLIQYDKASFQISSTAAGYGELCVWFKPIRNWEIFWMINNRIIKLTLFWRNCGAASVGVLQGKISSPGLIMWIGHCKEIRKLTFRALDLRFAPTKGELSKRQLPSFTLSTQLIKPNYLVTLFWLAKSVQWMFKIRARDVITANHAIIMSRTLKVTGNHVKFVRSVFSREEAKGWLPFFPSMYNKAIIRFGICDIQNNQGRGKGL